MRSAFTLSPRCHKKKPPNVALQRRAHATYQRSPLPASPLQALVGRSALPLKLRVNTYYSSIPALNSNFSLFLSQIVWAFPKNNYIPTHFRQLKRVEGTV